MVGLLSQYCCVEMNIIMSRALPHQYPHRLPPTQPAITSKVVTPTSPLDFTDRIPFNEIKLSSETLGSGSFGTVFKGRWRGRHVAVKQFKTREEIDSFLVEVKQLSCVKHTNIVVLYGASTLADTAYLIMEYAEGGSLNHLLHECKQQEYDLRHACSWAMQTARGVAYLHGIRPKPIMHRDLKPANLLLFSRGKILKICDFGTACAVKSQMTNNTGSASYMAPEVFATSSYLESGDVFSWSIIFWEILVRMQPYSQQYSNPYQILWRVNQGTRPAEIEACPKPIWDLIIRSWDKNPRKRPSMQQVAEEMEFIFSLAERTGSGKWSMTNTLATTSANSPQQVNEPILPIFSQLDNRFGPPPAVESRQNLHHHQTQLLQEHHYHHHRHFQRQQCLQQSIHSKTVANDRRPLLQSRVQVLEGHFKQLENRLRLDKKNSAEESFEEFKRLKEVINRLKQQVSHNVMGSNSSSSLMPQHLSTSPHEQQQFLNFKKT